MHPQFHAFYLSLITDASIVEEVHPSIPEISDEEWIEGVVVDVLESVVAAVTENADEELDDIEL